MSWLKPKLREKNSQDSRY